MSDTNAQPRGRLLARIAPVLAIVALAVGLWFGLSYFERGLQRPPPPVMQSAFPLSQPRPLPPFQLTADDGAPFNLDSLRGHWTLMAFGYTQCPDICPTTLATYKEIDRLLAESAGSLRPEFLFVSVDPERDSPERLGTYVRYFSPGFRGATGPHEALHALTDPLGILYARAEGQDTALGYLVDHSASILVIDPQARLAAIFSPPHNPRAMAEDFAALAQSSDPRP